MSIKLRWPPLDHSPGEPVEIIPLYAGACRMCEIEKLVKNPSALHIDFVSKIRGDETTLEIFNSLSEKLKNGSIKNDELIYLSEIRSQVNKIKSFRKAA